MSLWVWLLPIIMFITFGLTWFIYVAVMRLQTVWDGLHPVVKAIAVPPAIIGYVLDVVWVNWCLFTILFLYWPTTITASKKLSMMEVRADWRGVMGRWLCKEMLDKFDSDGRHC